MAHFSPQPQAANFTSHNEFYEEFGSWINTFAVKVTHTQRAHMYLQSLDVIHGAVQFLPSTRGYNQFQQLSIRLQSIPAAFHSAIQFVPSTRDYNLSEQLFTVRFSSCHPPEATIYSSSFSWCDSVRTIHQRLQSIPAAFHQVAINFSSFPSDCNQFQQLFMV